MIRPAPQTEWGILMARAAARVTDDDMRTLQAAWIEALYRRRVWREADTALRAAKSADYAAAVAELERAQARMAAR